MPKQDLSDIETGKLRRSDHDLLIRLESKVDDIASDVKDLKDGTGTKLNEHELRIRKLEETAEKAQVDKRLNQIDELITWMANTKVSIKYVIAIVATATSILTFFLKLALDYWLRTL